MASLWIFLGIASYFLGIILFIIVDAWYLSVNNNVPFKRSLLNIIDDNLTMDDKAGIIFVSIFWPFGIIVCLIIIIKIKLIRKIRNWCLK